MRTHRTRFTALFVLALIFVATAAVAAPPQLDLSGFHANSTMTSSAGPMGPMEMQAEIWIKEGKIRMNMETPMGPTTTIMDGEALYMWQGGSNQGMKSPLNEQQKASSLLEVNNCLKTASDRGGDTVDGVASTKWEYSDCGAPGSVTTIWIPNGKKWPKKLETRMNNTTTTIVYNDVETGAEIADAQFTPPSEVAFNDMSEMLRRMQEMQKKAAETTDAH